MSDINKRSAGQGKVCFNFTPEQQAKFDDIYTETKKLYPELCGDEISSHRTKVLIAHSVLTNDAPLFKSNETTEDTSLDNDIVKVDLDDVPVSQ
jgi:hypothetical protein